MIENKIISSNCSDFGHQIFRLMNKGVLTNAAVPGVSAVSAGAAAEKQSISEDIPNMLTRVEDFLSEIQYSSTIPPALETKDSYSEFFRNFLQVRSIQKGKISCILHVKPPIMNFYKGMHGGAVAAVTELLAYACAKTVVGKDKQLFLGELGTSYLSAASENAKLLVDGSVVRSGRNVTSVTIEFKHEESGKLVYSSRATFYNMPAASL